MTLKDYFGEKIGLMNGVINEISLEEDYLINENPYIVFIPFVEHNKKFTKLKLGAIVEAEATLIGEYSIAYKIKSVVYPDNLPENYKFKTPIIGNVFTENKIYENCWKSTLEDAKIEFDERITNDDNEVLFNEYKFYKLSELELAKKWYNNLSETEKQYIRLMKI